MASSMSMALPNSMTCNDWNQVQPCTSLKRKTSLKHSPKISASSLADNSALLKAAHKTLDMYVKSGMVVGLGCGRASEMAIQYLGRQLRKGALRNIVGIPMTTTSANEAAKAGIPLDYHQDNTKIDFAFDDADVIEEGSLAAIIGRQCSHGEESLIQEKSILKAANQLVFMVSDEQYRIGLEGSIPILVQSFNWLDIAEEIDDIFLGDAEVWRRSAVGYAGPHGGEFPFVTKEGHNVLDLIFTSPILSLVEVANSLDKVDGVVDHGVISNIPCTAIIASDSGPCIVDSLIKKVTEDSEC